MPFARDKLPGLVSNVTSNAINIFIKISRKEAVRAGKGLTLFISNEDMDITKIKKKYQKIRVYYQSMVLLNSKTRNRKTRSWIS